MVWPVKTIATWDDFLHVSSVAVYGSPFSCEYLFRGQADSSWSLKPSLVRCLDERVGPEEAISIEQAALDHFRFNAHRYLSSNLLSSTANLLQWWSIMQHHNAPTSLLDWTKSIFIAAYFAVEQLWDRDGAIWFFNPQHVISQTEAKCKQLGLSNESFVSYLQAPKIEPMLLTWFPDVISERMAAQQGCFTYSINVLGDQENIIDESLGSLIQPLEGLYYKVIIPRDAKPVFLRKLISMNITANTLFPGVDGLGKSITEQVRLSNHFC